MNVWKSSVRRRRLTGFLPLWQLLAETVNQSARDKKPSPVMSGATARAVWNNDRYPAALLNGVMLRIRADSEINWRRAAIIKAYYLKNKDKDCPEEVLTVSLNESSTNIPYTLGRLFSIYEAVQQAANPGINTTIKDKYFNSASLYHPRLSSLFLTSSVRNICVSCESISKFILISKSARSWIFCTKSYPARLNLPQQGSFDLGYYHQTQKRYTKKEDK